MQDVENPAPVAVYVVFTGLPVGRVNAEEALVTAGVALAFTVREAGLGALPPPVVGVLTIVIVVALAGAVTRFPPASSMATYVVRVPALPTITLPPAQEAVVPVASVTNINWVAAPVVIVKLVPAADVRAPSVAVNV
jgi:hypothetical protein